MTSLYFGPFTVTRRDGATWVEPTLAATARACRDILGRIGAAFGFTPGIGDPGYGRAGVFDHPIAFIVRDLFGRSVGADDLRAALPPRPRRSGRGCRLGAAPGEAGFRNETVPGTGHAVWHKGSFDRRPRTQAERRANLDERELMAAGVKIRRARLTLPSSRDDARRAAADDRSWKRHRATQWKD